MMHGDNPFRSTEGQEFAVELFADLRAVGTQRETLMAEMDVLAACVGPDGRPAVGLESGLAGVRKTLLRGMCGAAIVADKALVQRRWTHTGAVSRGGYPAFFLPGIVPTERLLGAAWAAARAGLIVRECLWVAGDRGMLHPGRLRSFDEITTVLASVV